ncbi:MAG: AAA family ATPase [Candidatus Thiodiazotropha sp.]|jgi:general secretion pathway protein A
MKFSDFGFKENPFAITPDPRYLYLSRGHEESLAHLIYGTGPNGGFVLLTGEVGTGKTLLLRSLLAQHLDNVDIALILNPRLSRREFIATICDELGIRYKGPPYSLKILIDTLTKHLLKTHSRGKHTVLVVDEAQNLNPRVLEQIRLLTNLETSRHKLLRIILVGQPELLHMLARKEMRQVDQRITARFHLSPLNAQEVGRYITHRLAVAGVREDLFTSMALRLIHHYSGGIPRIINSICERTLLAIYTSGRHRVGARLVRRAAQEVKGRRSGKRGWLWGSVLLISLMGVLGFFYNQTDLDPAVESSQVKKLADKAIPELSEVVGESQKVVMPESNVDRAEIPAPPPPVKEEPDKKTINSLQKSSDLIQTELPDDDFKLAQLFSQQQNNMDMYQMLLGLWGEAKQLQDNTPPCLQVRKFDLRCLSSVTDWKNLLGMNRPLLLQLKQKDLRRLLLLKHVDGEWLLVNSGKQDGVITRSQLMRFWNGGFIMLWRPLAEIALIGEGSSGSAVTWLRKRLQRVDGIKAPVIEGLDRFDAKLEDRLKTFQQRQGLTADGVAGQQTMIHLNNLAIPVGTPTLVSNQDLAGG